MRMIIFLLSMTLLFTPLVSAKENVDKVVLATPPLVNYNPKDNIPVDIKPVLLYQPEFKVPENYIPSTESASIWMSVLIDSEGGVRKDEIEFLNEDSVLNQIALKSVFKFKFKPAIRDGLPVFYWMWWEINIKTELVNDTITYVVLIDFDERLPSQSEYVPYDVLPELIHQVMPIVPQMTKSANFEGAVLVKSLIDKYGNIVKSIIAKSSGSSSIDDACLKVAPQNKFKSGYKNGKPINCWVTYKVSF